MVTLRRTDTVALRLVPGSPQRTPRSEVCLSGRATGYHVEGAVASARCSVEAFGAQRVDGALQPLDQHARGPLKSRRRSGRLAR